jgi:hypothetical protein
METEKGISMAVLPWEKEKLYFRGKDIHEIPDTFHNPTNDAFFECTTTAAK